ncbi:glycosyltransferase family 4 protein [Candidatus Woesearchaeota archaeon]|nr:glycosyltransferase family 4 protein [Candidatus Woesearchaeota archaeon]
MAELKKEIKKEKGEAKRDSKEERAVQETNEIKKKLLIASDCYLPRWDGIARFLSEVLPDLSKKYTITLIVPDFPGEKHPIAGVHIIYLPLTKRRFGDYQVPAFSTKKVQRVVSISDGVFTQTLGPIGVTAIRCAKKMKKPLITYIHSTEWELVPKSVNQCKKLLEVAAKWFCRWMYNKPDLLLVPSKDTADKLDEIGVAARKHTVHLGVNTDYFVPPSDKARAKQAVHIHPDDVIIGFSGRVAREKDLPTLYTAFRKLKERYMNLKLLIIGRGIPLREVFSALDDVIHVPHTNDIHRYLQAMDIYVMPSHTETSSLSTLEAMSCGLPVVSTNVGHIKEYITDGKNGYFFPIGDAQQLARKLAQLIETEHARATIGLAARATVLHRYSWKKTIHGLCQEIDDVLRA